MKSCWKLKLCMLASTAINPWQTQYLHALGFGQKLKSPSAQEKTLRTMLTVPDLASLKYVARLDTQERLFVSLVPEIREENLFRGGCVAWDQRLCKSCAWRSGQSQAKGSIYIVMERIRKSGWESPARELRDWDEEGVAERMGIEICGFRSCTKCAFELSSHTSRAPMVNAYRPREWNCSENRVVLVTPKGSQKNAIAVHGPDAKLCDELVAYMNQMILLGLGIWSCKEFGALYVGLRARTGVGMRSGGQII